LDEHVGSDDHTPIGFVFKLLSHEVGRIIEVAGEPRRLDEDAPQPGLEVVPLQHGARLQRPTCRHANA